MPRSPSRHPTEGELEILNVLWNKGPCELGAVRAELRKVREVATTTVATMLKLMESKGLTERTGGEGGRGTLWSAKVDRDAARSGLVRRLVDLAFGGSAQGLVAHMLEKQEISESEQAAIRAILEEGAAPRRKGDRRP